LIPFLSKAVQEALHHGAPWNQGPPGPEESVEFGIYHETMRRERISGRASGTAPGVKTVLPAGKYKIETAVVEVEEAGHI
jgi:hypothetical protein